MLSCVTKLLARSFHFEREIKGGLMLDLTLLVPTIETCAESG